MNISLPSLGLDTMQLEKEAANWMRSRLYMSKLFKSWPTPGLNVCRMCQICQRCTSQKIQKVSLLDPQQSASLFVENTSDIPDLTSDRPWVSLSEAVLVDPTLGSHLGQLDSSYMQSPFDLSPKTTKTTSQNNCGKTSLDCKDSNNLKERQQYLT